MIRVTSGYAKGKKLLLPKSQKVTAVKEVVKLAIFSIIGDKIIKAICLDLYAGSGNVGIEALSRGAVFCDFVDENKTSIDTIETNLRNTGFTDRANPIRDDSLKFLSNMETQYDIIFADPYYVETNHRHLIRLSLERLKPHGLFFLLTSSENSSRSASAHSNKISKNVIPSETRNPLSPKYPTVQGILHCVQDDTSDSTSSEAKGRVEKSETRRYGKTLLTIFQNT